MMMTITWLEMKKAIFSPIIVFLLVIFISFNIFTIISSSHFKVELKIVDEIVAKYGLSFNDEILDMMQQDLNEDVELFNSGYENSKSFLQYMTYEKYEKASLKEKQEIDRISLMQIYIGIGKGLEQRYENLNIKDHRDYTIQQAGLTGVTKSYVTKEYEKLSERFKEIKENGEYRHWFFAGEYRMHGELFRTLLKNIAIQGAMLVILLTAIIVNYEFEHRTQLVTYSTKKGRRLVLHKLIASLWSTIIVLIPLFGMTLIVFFTVYDYSSLWKTPISSGLNWEYNWPYITWWPVEFAQYLWLAIGILVLTLLLVSIFTFIIGLLVKNSYFTWILCVLLLISLYMIPMFFSGIVLVVMNFNLTLLIMNPHLYFSGISGLTMFQHHEMITLASWLIFSTFCLSVAIRKFYRKDII